MTIETRRRVRPATLALPGVTPLARRWQLLGWPILVVAALLAMLSIAGAHHGWGSYDVAKKFTITAPVKHLTWANPHGHVILAHDGADWEATLAPLSRMQSRGLSEEMLKAGTTISVEGYPSTRTPNEMRVERITVGGKTVELR